MPKINEKDLAERYDKYRRRVKEIKKVERETEKRAIAKAALEFNVSQRTIENAVNNRPMNSKRKIA